MKKTFIISLIILSIVLSAIQIFDSKGTLSANNEGLRKPDVAVKTIQKQNR